MFSVISLGLRLLFWPFICLGPFVVLVFPFFWFYPLATVHLTQKYTYKAWVGWEMLKIGIRNIGPAAYYCLIAFVVFLPVAFVAAPMFWVMGLDGGGNPYLGGNIHRVCLAITDWFLKLTGDAQPNPETFVFILCMIPLKIIAAFLTLTPIFLVAAIPSVFMMRVNGCWGTTTASTRAGQLHSPQHAGDVLGPRLGLHGRQLPVAVRQHPGRQGAEGRHRRLVRQCAHVPDLVVHTSPGAVCRIDLAGVHVLDVLRRSGIDDHPHDDRQRRLRADHQ
jgi:hypothetical protein